MVCYGCFAFFLLLGGLLVTLVGYYPLDMDHTDPHLPMTLAMTYDLTSLSGRLSQTLH